MLDLERAIKLMILALGFHAGDLALTRTLLEWIADLGGCSGHACALIADADVPWNSAARLKSIAEWSFDECRIFTNGSHVDGWIPGSNSLFKTAAVSCAGNPFMWLEPDCVPTKSGWLDHIQTAYKGCRKPFMGALVSHELKGWPNPYLEGPAVYPPNAWSIMEPTFRMDQSWTSACASISAKQAENTPLIQHVWGEAGNPPTFAAIGVPGTNVFGLDRLKNEAVVFHRNKDGSLIKLLREKRGLSPSQLFNQETVFGHGGDAGDLIYGLCAVKACGGGKFAITRHQVREAFNHHKAALMIPLLEQQSYLFDIGFEDGEMTRIGDGKKHEIVDVDLNRFRDLQFARRHHGHWETITATHLRLLGLPTHLGNTTKWLEVKNPNSIPGKPVVFNRTERYRNPFFPWKRLVDHFRNRAIFVGTPKEHNQFISQFGGVPRIDCKNYLELAETIAGSSLFVGNQSCAYAMAEGMKVNAILECSLDVPDCIFERERLIVCRDGNLDIPQID